MLAEAPLALDRPPVEAAGEAHAPGESAPGAGAGSCCCPGHPVRISGGGSW